jgi:hypothetical protein
MIVPKIGNLISYNKTISPPNSFTRKLSVFSIICFLIALLGGAYGFSIADGKISDDDFTVSQALAHGNKFIMITFFVISFGLMAYLNYLRSSNFLYKLRILLILIISTLILTIMWVTVAKNKKVHYILAGIIFTSNIVYLLTISYIFNDYLKKEKQYKRYVLDIIILLTFTAWIILLVFGVFSKSDDDLLDDEIFAITENITVCLTALPILYLGFI